MNDFFIGIFNFFRQSCKLYCVVGAAAASDKISPLVDIVDIAAIAAGLRKGSAISVGGDSSGDERNSETPTPFPVTSQIGTGGLSRQNSLRRIEASTLAAASAQVALAASVAALETRVAAAAASPAAERKCHLSVRYIRWSENLL